MYVSDELMLMTLVRTLIALSVEALRGKRSRRERLIQIVLRCDLQQQLHKKVAADLGLSLRQFYRDRRHALHQLDVALRQELLQWRMSQIVAPDLEVSRLLRHAMRTECRELRFILLTRALRLTSDELDSSQFIKFNHNSSNLRHDSSPYAIFKHVSPYDSEQGK